MSKKYSKTYKSKNPSKKTDYYEKAEYYPTNMRLKASKGKPKSKPKPKKPKKHVFECGRKFNKPPNSMWTQSTNSLN